MVDPSSISERKQPNALNWDKINPASYKQYSDVNKYLRKLTVKHEERIKDDPVAAIIPNEQVRYEKLKEGKTIPVNFEKRKLIFDEESAFELANTNIRLKAMGKDPVKSVKDLPEDFEFDDSVLLETVNIASDYASMLKDDGVNFADHQD
jgi:carboxyl-terminal processing protease